jgi:secreted protein with Ig-like and vWFA domain
MKPFLLTLLFPLFLFSGQLHLDRLETTVLQKKSGEPINVELSVVLQGRDVEQNEVQLMDVVQTALGSFWAETLLTAQGKAQFKKMVIDLADRQYGIEVDFVYLQNIRVETDTLQKCLELIKSHPPKF